MSGLGIYTAFHTALSLIAIATGIVAMPALFGRAVRPIWTTTFLVTAIATSVTGFGFPFLGILPSHVVGVVALLVLAIALVARRRYRLAGAWRAIDAVALVASLYFLVFVLIAQAFLKVPSLNRLAPTGGEPAFAVAQLITLAAFVVLAIAAARAAPRRAAPAAGGRGR